MPKLRPMLKQAVSQLINALFPINCIQCRASGSSFCAACRARLSYFAPPVCPSCGDPQIASQMCMYCRYNPLPFHGLRAFSDYTEPLRSIIHEFKYRGNPLLGEPLGTLLAQTYQRHHMYAELILPVPLHPTRLQQRGYNQAQLLAVSCARQLQLPITTTLLARSRTTATQVKLNAQQRRSNLQGAFYYPSNVTTKIILDRKILIIDDVCTTGATLEACATTLLATGAREVWGLVLAHPSVTNHAVLT